MQDLQGGPAAAAVIRRAVDEIGASYVVTAPDAGLPRGEQPPGGQQGDTGDLGAVVETGGISQRGIGSEHVHYLPRSSYGRSKQGRPHETVKHASARHQDSFGAGTSVGAMAGLEVERVRMGVGSPPAAGKRGFRAPL